jgi:arsenite methyltransferase
VAGALDKEEYRILLVLAGFEEISMQATRVSRADDARECLAGADLDVQDLAAQIDGKFINAFVRASKPDDLLQKQDGA